MEAIIGLSAAAVGFIVGAIMTALIQNSRRKSAGNTPNRSMGRPKVSKKVGKEARFHSNSRVRYPKKGNSARKEAHRRKS